MTPEQAAELLGKCRADVTVRGILRGNDDRCYALCLLAMRGRKEWTLGDWNARMRELESGNQTIAEFLALND